MPERYVYAPAVSPIESLALVAALFGMAFLIGSIPFGLLVGRLFFATDIRQSGSGNIGAANALRTLGKGGAIAVLLLDALKGFVPTAIPLAFGAHFQSDVQTPFRLLAAGAGFAALLGHCYSPWLRFRGGKGVATHLGVTFALSWPAGGVFIAVWAAAALSSGFSSAGSLVATLASALALYVGTGPTGLLYGAAAALVIFWRHRTNISRLRTGSENRLDLFKKRNSA